MEFSLLKKSIFLTLIFVANLVFSQSDGKLVKLADDVFEYGDKRDALEIYKQALAENPSNVRANYMAGVSYLETVHKPRALKYFQKAYEIDAEYVDEKQIAFPEHQKSLLLLIGISYHFAHDFDNALSYYERYKNKLSQDLSAKKITKETYDSELKIVERKIYECNNGKEFVANPVEFKIENIGDVVNSPYPDYVPAISADESIMIFTSRRPGGASDDKYLDNMFFEDIYIARKNGDAWGYPQNITEINSISHDAAISVSPDGSLLFLYKDEGSGDIYTSEYGSDGKWSVPKPFKEVNSKHRENHICSNFDETMMFFSSDRPGGKGKEDIYMIKKEGSGWSKPELLPENINTEMDEDGPFMAHDGKTLYFSSRGHKGMGGYDIFKSVYDEENNTWSEPENLGYPINTADDDVYISYNSDETRAYYSSVKEEGLGEKDIYLIHIPKPVEEIVEEETQDSTVAKQDTTINSNDTATTSSREKILNPVLLSGKITDAATGSPLKAKIVIRNTTDNSVEATMYADVEGNYKYEFRNQSTQNYTVDAELTGYIFASGNVSIPAMTENTQYAVKNLQLSKVVVGKTVVLRNIYYDFDKWDLKSESFAELDKVAQFMTDNPTVKIEMGGHTDKIGSNEYNIILSKRRAESCRKFLVNKGIDASRLTSSGYGEEQPLVSNDDETDGREINRRTEFKILRE